jgi:hypothetical protein
MMSTGTAPPRATVSEAVERGGQALYVKAMPRGATPWHRHSHAFQGIYLERAGTVLAAGLDLDEMAGVLLSHSTLAWAAEPSKDTSRARWLCLDCGEFMPATVTLSPQEWHAAHQAAAMRARLLGGAA